MSKKANNKSTFSAPARLLALIMAILIASGTAFYLIAFFLGLF